MIPNKTPTQEELDKYKDGDKLKITWSGGNKGTYIVRWYHNQAYVFAAYILYYKDQEYREHLIENSLLRLKDYNVWECEKI
jgi:hypothetical protein